MLRPFASLLLLAAALAAMTCHAQAADWPQFLGPNRNGISPETGLIQQWPADGLKQLWRVPGGVGMSGVVVADGQAITMAQASGQQFVIALDAKTGKTRWRSQIAPAYTNGQGNGPRATPCIAGDQVFAYTGEGILAALDARSGVVKWQRDAQRTVNLKEAEYGMASSPLVIDKQVIVMAGGNPGKLVSFSVNDGSLIWQSGDRDQAGYSSPVLMTIHDRPHLVAFTGSSVVGVNPENGTTLWRYTFVTDFACNIATPVAYGKNQLLISAGENHGSVLLQIDKSDEQYTPQVVWDSLGRTSVLRSAWQTGVLNGNYLYGFDNVGAAGPVMHYTCIDLRDGSQQWTQLRFGKGNHTAADGKLFISTMKGELVVVAIDPTQYRELGRMDATGMTRQAPAIAGGRLYLRDDKEIVCYDISRP